MLTAAVLTPDGKLDAAAIAAAPADAAAIAAALGAPASDAHATALAIVAGIHAVNGAQGVLIAQLAKSGGAGKAAGWALGRSTSAGDGSEAALLTAIADGKLNTRENGYLALAVIAARGLASPGLAAALDARVQIEIARTKAGGSGLAEHATRVLAVLGAPELGALIQQVLEQDQYCDRFELQRQRKTSEGRDTETIRELTGPWTAYFADLLPAATPAAPPAVPAKAQVAAPTDAVASPTPNAPGHADDANALDGSMPGEEPPVDGAGEAGPAPVPIDWKAFQASPECLALPAPLRQLAGQLGPLLEQLAARAIHAALTDLNAQEFAGLLLQVLPQALPPQHVQMALGPQALHGYQAIAKYLIRAGLATSGDELLSGVKLVRKELTAQLRQSGMLGGPDYSDPDEKPAKA